MFVEVIALKNELVLVNLAEDKWETNNSICYAGFVMVDDNLADWQDL